MGYFKLQNNGKYTAPERLPTISKPSLCNIKAKAGNTLPKIWSPLADPTFASPLIYKLNWIILIHWSLTFFGHALDMQTSTVISVGSFLPRMCDFLHCIYHFFPACIYPFLPFCSFFLFCTFM